MVGDNNSKAQIYMLPYHSQRAFICILPCDIQNRPLRNIGQWLFTSKRNRIIQEVRGLTQSQDTGVLTLDISHGHLWGNTHCPGPSRLHAEPWENRESKKCLRLGLPPHEPVPRHLWFLRETISSHWHRQRSGTWGLMEKAGRATLGEIHWNRQDLTCQCAAFPSPPGSALMLRTERKEWRAEAHFSKSL